MFTKEFNFRGKVFDYNGLKMDCELAIEKDTEVIIMEAKSDDRKEEFEELYDEKSLRPIRIRMFFGEDEKKPLFAMIIYVIDYKNGGSRTACGNYYPFYEEDGFLMPHQCQGSICW